MSSIKKSLFMTVANTAVELEIHTNLTIDGKQAWSIAGMSWQMSSGFGAAVPSTANAVSVIELNTETGSQSFTDNDNIILIQDQFRGVAASSSSIYIPSRGQNELIIPRVTVQPTLFLRLASTGMTAAYGVNVEIFYEVIKLTDVEVLRLMQGGA